MRNYKFSKNKSNFNINQLAICFKRKHIIINCKMVLEQPY